MTEDWRYTRVIHYYRYYHCGSPGLTAFAFVAGAGAKESSAHPAAVLHLLPLHLPQVHPPSGHTPEEPTSGGAHLQGKHCWLLGHLLFTSSGKPASQYSLVFFLFTFKVNTAGF